MSILQNEPKSREKSKNHPSSWENAVSKAASPQASGCSHNSLFTFIEIKKAIHKNQWNLSSHERNVLLELQWRQGPTGQLNVSTEILVQHTGASQRTVERALHSLEEKKIIERSHYWTFNKGNFAKRRQININWDFFMTFDDKLLKKQVTATMAGHSSSSSLTLSSSSVLGTPVLDSICQRKALTRALPTQIQCPSQEKDEQPLVNLPLAQRTKEIEGENMEVKFVPSAAALEAISKLPSLAELAEMAKKAPKFVEQQAAKVTWDDEQHVRELMDKPFDKAAARLRRLNAIPERYKDTYEEVLEREQCTLNQLRRRMWANWEYEPLDRDDQWWNPCCHPDYALMDESERDRLFIHALEIWMWPKPFRYTARQRKMFQNTRARADSIKVTYYEFIAAQYEYFGPYEINYERVCCKAGVEIHKRWKEEERGIPDNHGSIHAANQKMLRHLREPAYHRKPKVSFEALLEQDRKELNFENGCL